MGSPATTSTLATRCLSTLPHLPLNSTGRNSTRTILPMSLPTLYSNKKTGSSWRSRAGVVVLNFLGVCKDTRSWPRSTTSSWWLETLSGCLGVLDPLRRPTAGLEDIYGKYTSLYYPNSFLNVIRNTYPAISTGVIREFRATEGEFRDGASLAETLDGEVNVAMLVYKNAEAALQLFGGEPSAEAQKILGAVLPALATNGDYKVLLVQPENQDWDVNLVARHPMNLIDV